MSELIVTVQETNGCACHCQGKLSTQPASVWIFQVWTFFYPFLIMWEIFLPIMPCTVDTRAVLFAPRRRAPPPPLLSFARPLLLFLFWLRIVLDYWNTFCLYPVESHFQMERITSLNAFPFGTKLRRHTPVKRASIRKLCQVHYLASLNPPPPPPLVSYTVCTYVYNTLTGT